MPFQYRSYQKNIPYWPLNHVSSVSHFDISGGTIKKLKKKILFKLIYWINLLKLYLDL